MPGPGPSFVVLHPTGEVVYGRAGRGELTDDAIGAHLGRNDTSYLQPSSVPDAGLWLLRVSGADGLAPNPLADHVLALLDRAPRSPMRGPIALRPLVSTAPLGSGLVPELPEHIRDTIAAAADYHRHAAAAGQDPAAIPALVDAQLAAGPTELRAHHHNDPRGGPHMASGVELAARWAAAQPGTDLNTVDPLDLAEYLLSTGWHHTGLLHPHSGHHRPDLDPVIVFFRAPSESITDVAFPLRLRHSSDFTAIAATLSLLSDHEDRDPATLDLTDLAGLADTTAGSATIPVLDLPALGEPERRMRHAYTEYERLTRTGDTHAAQDLAAQWVLEDRSSWLDLHDTVVVWRDQPALMTRLHAVLSRHPDSVEAYLLRDHRHAAHLTSTALETGASALGALELAGLTAAPAASYIVTWTIDIDATEPESAARKALTIHRNPDSIATIFDVTPHGGGATTTIDITALDQQPETPTSSQTHQRPALIAHPDQLTDLCDDIGEPAGIVDLDAVLAALPNHPTGTTTPASPAVPAIDSAPTPVADMGL